MTLIRPFEAKSKRAAGVRGCEPLGSSNAIATPAAREPGPLVTRWRSLTLARKFYDNAVRSLPEERAAEIAARTLASPTR